MAALERHFPAIVGALASLLAWLFLPTWQAYLTARTMELDRVFGPVFDLATFSAGSLFAIYVLALSRSDGFVGSIFKTETFRLFHGYVGRSIALCVIASLWTVVYIVLGMGDLRSVTSLLLASWWVGFAAAAFASVGRVVVVFMIMVGAGTKRRSGKQAGQAS